MSNFTETSVDYLLLGLFTDLAVPARPTEWFVSLHTGDPGFAGANEVDGGTDANYVRQSVSFVVDATGQVDVVASDVNVSFPVAPAGADYTVTHIGVWDAVTGGNILTRVMVPGSGVNIFENRAFTMPAGDLVLKPFGA